MFNVLSKSGVARSPIFMVVYEIPVRDDTVLIDHGRINDRKLRVTQRAEPFDAQRFHVDSRDRNRCADCPGAEARWVGHGGHNAADTNVARNRQRPVVLDRTAQVSGFHGHGTRGRVRYICVRRWTRGYLGGAGTLVCVAPQVQWALCGAAGQQESNRKGYARPNRRPRQRGVPPPGRVTQASTFAAHLRETSGRRNGAHLRPAGRT